MMGPGTRTRETTAPAPVAAPEPETQVFVRMYRALAEAKDGKKEDDPNKNYKGLLGDCFLIRIVKGDVKSHILIDCGLLMGSPDAQARMKRIAQNIVDTCGGKLDLLVVTHEHWDHISGFSQARDILLNPAKLAIGKIWMAWTEDDSDPLTKELRARFDKSGMALAAIAERLDSDRTARFGVNARQTAMEGLQGFLGATETGAKPGKGKLQGREIMEALKRDGVTEYRRPGEVGPTPGDVSLRAYVLGPPHDKAKLFKDLPSKNAPETYLDTPSFDSLMLRFAEGQDPDPDTDPPFARSYCRIGIDSLSASLANGAAPEGDAREWLRARYYGLPNSTSEATGAITRRRIDGDWLAAAGQMALKLDSDTNNTSLVLAFELPDPERSILLFAADAQVGNWLSWHDQDYDAGDGSKPQSATDLLERVRFYKVGHHGSHNATLDKQGLARMTRDDLVAAIPTDEELGKKQGSSGWMMPNPRVNTALIARTNGRILRNDRTYLDDKGEPLKRADLDAIERNFFKQLTEAPMFLEYQVMGTPQERNPA